MPFTSYDDLIGEMTAGKRLALPFCKPATTAPVANNWYHLWPVGGYPAAGTYPGTALAFQRTTETTTGALYHGGNKSTDTKHLIYKMVMSNAAEPKILMLVDMVGYYAPFTQSTSSQNFDNTNAPNRYVGSGEGGLLPVMVNAGSTAMGATASNITVLTYVNQDGTTGRLMPTTPSVAVTVSTALHTTTLGARVITTVAGPWIPLQAGDCGVRSLTNITFSAANTGTMAILLVRPLACIPFPAANVPTERDLVMQVANLERIYDGACLTWLVYVSAATAFTVVGQIDVAWG